MTPSTRRSALALALLVASAASAAQTLPPPQNVLNLAAQATQEVTQDLLSITLAATRDGSDSAAVQSQLRQALDAALAEARKAVRPGQLELRTGQFSIFPRYAPKGGIAGWQGSAELVIEGKDMAAISQLAGRLTGLLVTRVAQGLSREAREHVEAEVTAQAISRFKARADAYARQFGFAGYSLREVTLVGGDSPIPMQPMLRGRAMAAGVADESQPIEAGRATVTVSVNGSIQMSPR